ncbi:MAG: rod shape-determining protein MreD [Rubellimicrobium sp.]|nr:rod shape-determining protein MreD [Rubellimicrobium sp.]
MAEAVDRRPWPGRVLWVLLFVALVMVALMPFDTMPPVRAGPDLLLAITLLWVMRRPDLVPMPVIAVSWFIADFLLQRPPGLMTAFVLIATEALRRRNTGLRALPLVLEWLTASAVIIAVTLGYRIVLALLVTSQAPLGLSLMQMAMTILAWPVVALVARFVFGITRPAPGEVDALGKPI